jgi:ribonuclease HI
MLSIYTDGSCIGNPGSGGWAFVCPSEKSDSGSVPDTTNNRMELQAIIEALKWAGEAHPLGAVKVLSDSQLSIKVLSGNWRPKKNLDLVQEALRLIEARPVLLEWVRGHDFSLENNIADSLAYEAAQRGSSDTPMRRLKSV